MEKSKVIEVKVGDEFRRRYGDNVEIHKLISITTGMDPESKKDSKQPIYTFETYVNGERTTRPTFSMFRRWFEDYINRSIWEFVC